MTRAQSNSQDDSKGRPLNPQNTKHTKILAGILALIGLGLGLCRPSTAQEMCTIAGEQSACRIEAFLGGEHKDDREGFTCSKLNGVKYQGNCREGNLNGLVLLKRSADRRFDRRDSDQFIAMVKAGRVQYPIAIFDIQIVGVQYEGGSSGCVNFVQGWEALADESCIGLTNAFGPQIIKRDTWRSIRTGKFDLRSVSWNPAAGENRTTGETSRGDDPKTVGSGTRAG